MRNLLTIIGILAIFAVGVILGVSLYKPAPLPEPQVIREDVTLEVRPVLVASGTLKETVRVEVRDTVHHHDTTYVFDIPREVKVYADTSYRAVVSGVDPRLDSLTIHTYKETYYQPYEVTRWKEPPRWSFGVTAGPAVLYDGEIHAGAAIVVGLQYRF